MTPRRSAPLRAGLACSLALLLVGCGSDADVDATPASGGDVASSPSTEQNTDDEAADVDGSGGELRPGLATFQLSSGINATAEVLCQLDPRAAGDPDKQFEVTSTGSPSFELVVLRETLPTAEVRWVDDLEWRSDENVVAIAAGTLISGNGSFTADGDGNDSVAGRFHVDCDV